MQRLPVVLDRLQQLQHGGLPLACQNTVDRTTAVREKLLGDKGSTMATDEHEAVGEECLGGFGQIDNFRHVGEVVTRKGDNIGLPGSQPAEVVCMGVHLQIKETYLVAALLHSCGHQL